MQGLGQRDEIVVAPVPRRVGLDLELVELDRALGAGEAPGDGVEAHEGHGMIAVRVAERNACALRLEREHGVQRRRIRVDFEA